MSVNRVYKSNSKRAETREACATGGPCPTAGEITTSLNKCIGRISKAKADDKSSYVLSFSTREHRSAGIERAIVRKREQRFEQRVVAENRSKLVRSYCDPRGKV